MIKIAKVKDNRDAENLGRVKVEILPELQGIPDSLLPWASPIQKYDASKSFEQNIPAVGETIIVEVDGTWTQFMYDGSRPFSFDKGGYSAAVDVLGTVGYSGGMPSRVKCFDKEAVVFEDSSAHKAGVVFNDKSYVVWDNSSIKIYYKDSGTKIEMTDDNVSIDFKAATSIVMDDSKISINGDNLVVMR